MMNMDEQRLCEMVRDAVREAVAEERKALWVEPEQHFLDHEMLRHCRENSDEWRRNHEFVASLRQGADVMKRTGWRMAATSAITFLAAGAWMLFRELVRK